MTKYSNEKNINLLLAVWLANDEYDYDSRENRISATTLLTPIRQLILGMRVEETTDVMSMIQNQSGTAVHSAVESTWRNKKARKTALKSLGYNPKSYVINPKGKLPKNKIPIYIEKRGERKVGKWYVTAKFDAVVNGTVEDIKNTSAYIFTKHQKDPYDYVMQGSINRFVHSDIIKDDFINIHSIVRDWSKHDIWKSDYPNTPVVTSQFALLSEKKTEKWIKTKLQAIDKFKDKKDKLIPLCSDDELWMAPPLYKYYKNPQSLKRSTKNFEDADEAYKRMADDGNIGIVKLVKGTAIRCGYCQASSICKQRKQLKKQNLLPK